MMYVKLIVILATIALCIAPVLGADTLGFLSVSVYSPSGELRSYTAFDRAGEPIGDSISSRLALSLNALAIGGRAPAAFRDLDYCTEIALEVLMKAYADDPHKARYYAGELEKMGQHEVHV